MILTKANVQGKLAAPVSDSSESSDDDDDDKPEPPMNGVTMIVDATCAPSQIKFPQDTALLNKARENTEVIIDALHTPGEPKPRTYRKLAHKDHLALVRCRKLGAKKIRKCIGKQLNYLRRNLQTIEKMLSGGGSLTPRQEERLENNLKGYNTYSTKDIRTFLNILIYNILERH